MSAKVQITFPTDELQKAFAKRAAISKKGWTELFQTQMKSFIKKVAAATPPGNLQKANLEGKFSKSIFTSAKKGGEKKIRKDINRVFTVSRKALLKAVIKDQSKRKAENSQLAVMKSLHAQSRQNGTIRFRKPRYLVNAQAKKDFVKLQTRKVGFLASGWNAAATKLGSTLPTWIQRHSSPGAGTLKIDSGGKCLFEAKNAVRFAALVEKFPRYIQSACIWEARNLMKQVTKFLAKQS